MTTATTPKGYITVNGDDPIVNGDNVITTLATQIDTNLGRLAQGVVTIPTFGDQSIAVTFPAGRFTAAPSVLVTARVTASASNTAVVGSLTASATGVTLTATRPAGGSYALYWLAAQV